MTYPQTIRYLESFINYENIPAWPYKKSLKLERMRRFLQTIGNPHAGLRCIHIAGTKGKGSTCAFIAYILREAGYRVGLYTSPHLSDFRERIRVLERPSLSPRLHNRDRKDFPGMISPHSLARMVREIKPRIEEFNAHSGYGPLSFFEIYTALAFLYFEEKKVDLAVLETGLGGRLDATNVVNPLVAAITPLSYEHMDKLGHSLRQIALEKAGIIKPPDARCRMPNLTVISAPQEKEALQVIRKECKKAGARLYTIDKEITYQKTGGGFSIKGIFGEYGGLKIRLLGDHQLINASVAVGVSEALHSSNIDADINSIRKGLYNTLWPGRCEVASTDPLIVLDGAQNIASARALKETVRQHFRYKQLILVLGISSDKDIAGVCGQLYGLADTVILTQANNLRATPAELLAQYFCGKKLYITKSVNEAKELARRLNKKGYLTLVCGSLFVVGEFRDVRR